MVAYGHGLEDKPEIIALNKVDALSEEAREAQLSALREETGCDVFAVSAVSGQGVSEVLFRIAREVAAKKEQDRAQQEQPEKDTLA